MINKGERGLGNRGALDALNAGSIPASPTPNPKPPLKLGYLVLTRAREGARRATESILTPSYSGITPRMVEICE